MSQKSKKGYKPLKQLLLEINSDASHDASFPEVDHFFIDFKKAYTRDLLRIYRNIKEAEYKVYYADWIEETKKKKPKFDVERKKYLDLINKMFGTHYTVLGEYPANVMRLASFVENIDYYMKEVKKELDTREHIPSKKDGKRVRRLKAQGKFIVD